MMILPSWSWSTKIERRRADKGIRMKKKVRKNQKRLIRIKLRLGRKMTLFTLAGMILLMLCMAKYTVNLTRDITIDDYSIQSEIEVQTVAQLVDGDQIKTYYETGRTDAAYDETAEKLKQIKVAAEADYLSIVYPLEDSFVYIFDAEHTEYEKELKEQIFGYSQVRRDTAKLGDVHAYTDFERQYFLPDVHNKKASDDILCIDDGKGGYIITAWAPVFDHDGSLAAMVITEFEQTWVEYDERYIASLYLFIFISGIVILTICNMFFANRVVSKPMELLTKEIAIYDGGAIREKNQWLATGDEIETVYDTFYDLTHKLQKHIEDISRMTAESERISAELNIAAQIQVSRLPAVFPAFPEKEDIDIYALMNPAKEVGGDFYDFFLVDDNHLAVVVADVSGKGIPAALFMMISKSFIKNEVLEGKHVDEVFCEVNNQLCENNNENFFVTAWLGILDLKSGTLEYANAGHNTPLILHRDGSVEWMRMQPGLALAAMTDIPYFGNEIRLERGERLLLYTDGVTEAMNEQEEMYGEERLEQLLAGTSGMTVTETVKWLREDLRNFAGETQQYDDITILELEYREVK